MEDPTRELPRDMTGSYLHLKLKRFSNINDLSMKYAKTTWQKIPHHAEIDIASTNRSSCRHCHKTITKNQVRVRLWLQCHKGCKNSAYFHFKECFWSYPETSKLDTVDEIIGWDKLPTNHQQDLKERFDTFRQSLSNSNTSLFPKSIDDVPVSSTGNEESERQEKIFKKNSQPLTISHKAKKTSAQNMHQCNGTSATKRNSPPSLKNQEKDMKKNTTGSDDTTQTRRSSRKRQKR